jgi:hypothetical protein
LHEKCLGFDISLDLDNSALMDVCLPHRGLTLDVEPEVRGFMQRQQVVDALPGASRARHPDHAFMARYLTQL